jgi:hypothetical protein
MLVGRSCPHVFRAGIFLLPGLRDFRDKYVECQVVRVEKLSGLTGETTMTTTGQVSTFIPRDYDVFAGLDVDKRSIAITFTDHGTMRKSLKLPYSARQLLNY